MHDLGDLHRDPREQVDVLAERSVASVDRGEVPDLGCMGLAVAVDAADALLEPVRVERDVEVDQPVAVVLQVDALAGGVGGQQDPNRRLGGILVEPCRISSRVSASVLPSMTSIRSSS